MAARIDGNSVALGWRPQQPSLLQMTTAVDNSSPRRQEAPTATKEPRN